MRLAVTRNGYPRDGDDFDVIFSGQWCVADDIDGVAIENGATIIDHPWKNSERFHQDYQKIKVIYEQVLKKLSKSLNSIHGVDISQRGWEIFIGPWLRIFINCVFERAMLIEEGVKNYNVESLVVGIRKNANKISVDTSQFVKDQDMPSWNDQLSVEILNIILPNIEINFITNDNEGKESIIKAKNSKGGFKNTLKNIFCRLDAFFSKNRQLVIHRVGFSWLVEMKYMLRSKMVPHYFFPLLKVSDENFDSTLNRTRLDIDFGEEKFEQLISTLLPKYLPRIFFESFQDALKTVFKFYPSSPKHIVTGVAYYVDDLFKLFTATQIDQGVKYTILQHGGNFGVSVVNDEEELILKTADQFLTWGWKLPEAHEFSSKTIPCLSILLSNYDDVSSDPNGYIIFPVSEWTQNVFRLFNSPLSFRQLDYVDEISRLYEPLPDNVKKQFKLRMQPNKRGWHLKERFIKLGMGDSILLNKGSFVQELSRSRLSIINSNSTSILESLSLNFPTVILLNNEYWPLRDIVCEDYEQLIDVGIMYRDAKSAASHIARVFDCTLDWWNSSLVQEARLNFISKFARRDANTSKNLEYLKRIVLYDFDIQPSKKNQFKKIRRKYDEKKYKYSNR